jgi:putative transposase
LTSQISPQKSGLQKHADVLAALPKSAHPGALAVLKESCRAEDIDTARVAITALEIEYGAK